MSYYLLLFILVNMLIHSFSRIVFLFDLTTIQV